MLQNSEVGPTPACWVVISGLPASGKSTLARRLAETLAWPFIDKDAHLEALFDTQPVVTPAQRTVLSRKADALFQAAALRAGAAVMTSWWRHPANTHDSGTPTDWLRRPDRRLIEVHCTCPSAIALQRFADRQRHPSHGDRLRSTLELKAQLEAAEALGPLFPDLALTCTTAAPMPGSDVQALAQTIRGLAHAPHGH